MQYVRSIGGSVSKTWNSINASNLSGAIDVIVVEQEDGTLACSPFHVRFGKFSLLRPFEKKVEFKVNQTKQDFSMKLGEGGEAFFVFETSADVPAGLQTSPLVSPSTSPASTASNKALGDESLQEPEYLDLSGGSTGPRRPSVIHARSTSNATTSRLAGGPGDITPISASPPEGGGIPVSGDWSTTHLSPHAALIRSSSEDCLKMLTQEEAASVADEASRRLAPATRLAHAKSDLSTRSSPTPALQRSNSPPPVTQTEAINRAKALSQKLSNSNIQNQITESGDLMLDMTGYKSNEEDALRAELIARRILADELKGNYDIGALIGADERGNLWIYSSEEAKEAAMRKHQLSMDPASALSDAASDPGYQSEEESASIAIDDADKSEHVASDRPAVGLVTPPHTPPDSAGDPNRNYAKTLRLTSDQLKALNLKRGPNLMSFTVNRSTCQAHMHYWSYNVPVVISDIDGTITKSDALGHMFGMIGRDWTHPGVAKLYTDVVANGYNLFYLTSRSVGQADMTRAYLDGIRQDGYRLPKGPVILSPDRTIAALRREIYLRKPEVFKMACLRDILSLYGGSGPPAAASSNNGGGSGGNGEGGGGGGSGTATPFYAGFGNRLTDALSYRAVHIPPTRIFTINAQAEVSIDLLTMGAYRSSYVSMREVVDHFFPPVDLLVPRGGERFTDFSYWRDPPRTIEDFDDSDSEESEVGGPARGRAVVVAGDGRRGSGRSEDERGEDDDEDEEEDEDEEYDERLEESILSGDLADSMLESVEDDEEVLSQKASVEIEETAGRVASEAEAILEREDRDLEPPAPTSSPAKKTGVLGGLQNRPSSNPL